MMIFLNFFQMSLKSEVSDFSVFDSHCHLEFMQWRNAATETLIEKMLIWDWCQMEKRLFGTGAEWKKGCLALVPIIQKWLISTGPFHISGP